LLLDSAQLSPGDRVMAGMTYALGRVLLSIFFVVSGYQTFLTIATVAKMFAARNVPVPVQIETWTGLPRYEALGYAMAMIEILAGVMVLIGFKARWAAVLLFLVMIATLFVAYDLLSLDGALRAAAQPQALMHLSIMGALLLIAAAGAGPWSFDGRSRG
jgi:putative oxidoreductase